MEHDSSYNKRLRKEVRAVMNKKSRMLQADINKNNEKQDDIPREINRIKKAIRRRIQKNQDYRELSLRLNELQNLKTEIRKKIEALNK